MKCKILNNTKYDVKLLTYLFVVLLTMSIVTSPNIIAKSIENQTRATYEIYDVYDLQNMNNDLDGDYILMNDINATATYTFNEGAGFMPIGNNINRFTGTFNGQNYTISNLYMNWGGLAMGLFGVTSSDSIIINVGLENININSYYLPSSPYTGGLVGKNVGLIDNCYTEGYLYGLGQDGGLVGHNHGIINNSYSNVEIDTLDSLGYGSVCGGFVALNQPDMISVGEDVIYVSNTGIITNCYSLGNIIGSTIIGGFIGDNYAEISDCYSHGNVTGRNIPRVTNAYISGFAGRNYGFVNTSYSTGTVLDIENQTIKGFTNNLQYIYSSYYDSDVTGLNSTGEGEPKTTEEMKTQSTFVGWDFDDVWAINETETYPYFKLQVEEELDSNETVSVTYYTPPNNSTDVPINISIAFVFNSTMNTTSVENNFDTDIPFNYNFNWSVNKLILYIEFDDLLEYNTTYTFSLGINATDEEGNPLNESVECQFTTELEPETTLEPMVIFITLLMSLFGLLLLLLILKKILDYFKKTLE